MTAVERDDRFLWRNITVTVMRVSTRQLWADVRCTPPSGVAWTKRMPLPLPPEFVREEQP